MSITRALSALRRTDLPLAGGKGANLGELLAAGLPVPDGFVLTTDAYREFIATNGLQPRIDSLLASADPADPTATEAVSASVTELFTTATIPPSIQAALRNGYAGLGADVPVAVRSSATAEDLAEASFAGQQETLLNVIGAPALAAAVRRCWASLWSARAISYRATHQVKADLALAVVVQRLIPAEASGVMFTANPTNGRTDEIVISAAWGLGEAVVSGSVTTDDIVVRDGQVVDRTTAAKDVLTVRTADGVREQPTTESQRHAEVLSEADALTLAELGGRAAAHFGVPQDLEWARADGRFWLVQSRPITALPAPTGPAPTEWPVPPGFDVYMRASLIEQLPDPLSPLFADLAGELVVKGMVRTIGEFFGPQSLFTEKNFGFVTINGYAYYGYANSLMLKAIGIIPLALRVAFTTIGRDKWAQVFHPRYAALVEKRRAHDPATLTATDLLAGIVELVGEAFAYYTSVQTIIPEAVTSEAVFTALYDRLVKRPGDPRAEEFLLGFDSAPLRADQSIHDLAKWVRRDPALTAALTAQDRDLDGVDAGVRGEFDRRLAEHLTAHGHATYNLDLVNPVAADDPRPVLDVLRFYLAGGARSPEERRSELAARRGAARAAILDRLPRWQGTWFARLLGFANTMAPVREDALADVGLGWPAARAYARELGRRLVAAGALAEPDGVFWLRRTELAEAARRLDDGGSVDSFADRVAERKVIWRGQRLVTPPPILPLDSRWHAFDSMMPTVMGDQGGATLKGTGASGGRVSGIARVMHGPEDFGGMQPGEILVAAITTPAWTPLFALAAGVVTDVGGPLSHSSIVAREYGIPAVLGTTVATARIKTGDRILVDGEAGTVTLLDVEVAEPEEPKRDRNWKPWALGAAAAAVAAVAVGALRRAGVRTGRSARPGCSGR
ncbi:PEP/pyruvate-binding domain-containing protein [Ammonicoccus fulvus]|uniref:PEP/pyruvate-binding domain-containing protein n=1 Tax=Ammonicoccus fulvus TaxID=3138240 RepID=A0ABZ3FN21_9ACTN